MATIEKYCAPGVYDTPSYSQAIKVTSAQTILFLAGQVPYAPDGTVNHVGNFMGQARQVFGAVKALVEHAGGTLDNVVKITTYVTDIRRRLDFRVGPRRVLRPARAGVHDDRGQLALPPRLPDRGRGSGNPLGNSEGGESPSEASPNLGLRRLLRQQPARMIRERIRVRAGDAAGAVRWAARPFPPRQTNGTAAKKWDRLHG